jgi:RNA polymerase sigma-70 factor, ECF subfamily
MDEADAHETAWARAKSGDRGAFAALVRLHQRSVHGLALRMLARRDLADDVAQDVFLQLYRKLADIESARHLGLWLRRVTVNLAIDRLRQLPFRDSAQPLDEAEVPAPNDDHDPLLHRKLLELIADLAEQPRAVMLLRYQQDLDATDIATVLDMPINTVKSHLRRSLHTLREHLLRRGVSITEDLHDG